MTLVAMMKRLLPGVASPMPTVVTAPTEPVAADDRWDDPTLELRREFLVRWDDESASRRTPTVPRAPVSPSAALAPVAPIRTRLAVGPGFRRARACRAR